LKVRTELSSIKKNASEIAYTAIKLTLVIASTRISAQNVIFDAVCYQATTMSKRIIDISRPVLLLHE
jgi:hypothetical protein